MKPETILTTRPSQTKKLGESFAKEILRVYSKRAGLKRETILIGLVGDLGGGKTTFLQGFAKGLEIKEKILSPTFVLMKRFKIQDLRFKDFYHIDCYRIKKPKEILDLGFKEIIKNQQNVVVVEWADRVKRIMPKNTIWIKFEFVDEKTRRIVLK